MLTMHDVQEILGLCPANVLPVNMIKRLQKLKKILFILFLWTSYSIFCTVALQAVISCLMIFQEWKVLTHSCSHVNFINWNMFFCVVCIASACPFAVRLPICHVSEFDETIEININMVPLESLFIQLQVKDTCCRSGFITKFWGKDINPQKIASPWQHINCSILTVWSSGKCWITSLYLHQSRLNEQD